MKWRRQIMGHYKRWDIPLDAQKEFESFKNRILRAVDRAVGGFVLEHPAVSTDFSCRIGHRSPTTAARGMAAVVDVSRMMQGRRFSEDAVYTGLESTQNPEDLIFALQCLFWVLEEHRCDRIAAAAKAVRKAIDASPLAEIRVARRGNRVTLYPRGARLLDSGAVEDVLGWLGRHRKAAEAFERALQLYLQKSPAAYRDILDNLHVSLERLVKRVTGTRKSLENQHPVLAQWLEKKGVHKHLRNMTQKCIGNLQHYNNACVKHDDPNRPEHQPTEAEVEFVIYETATLMRMLLVLE